MLVHTRFNKRRQLALLIVTTLAPLVFLARAGWKAHQNGARFEDAPVAAALAGPAVAATLEAAVSATEQILRDPEAMRLAAVTPDSVTVTFDANRLEALPHGRLLFYPLGSSGPILPGSVLAPAELIDRTARCGRLADLRRTGELRVEALELREQLLDGRWRITRSAFELYLKAASEWAQAGEPPATYRLGLSAAVARLWASRPTDDRPADATPDRWTGRRFSMTVEGVPFTVLVQTNGTRTNALVAGPAYVQQEWRGKTARLPGPSRDAGSRSELR
jgi:hypothetical protein